MQNDQKLEHQSSGKMNPAEGQANVFMQNCQMIPYNLMRVTTKLDRLKIVLIHPINQTYPIFTMSFGKFELDYQMYYDHDLYRGSIGDFRIYDNTNYPLTLDPSKIYCQKEYPQHEILGLRNEKGHDQQILEFEC